MRVEGWEKLLVEYIEETKNDPFDWGNNNCIQWSARWVDIATGRDYSKSLYGRFKTKRGAYSLMKRRGFTSPEDAVSNCLERRLVQMARRGDLVLHEQNFVGICVGIKSYFVSEAGLVAHPTGACVQAWTVE